MLEELMNLSLNQLIEKAVEAGFDPEVAKTFKVKAQVVAVIEGLTAKTPEVKPKLVDPAISAKETPKEKKNADKAWLSKRDRMGRQLEKQPKVGIAIQLEPGEKAGVVESKVVDGIREFKVISGAVKTKIMNGYKWVLPKGVMTQVPQQIYEKLSEELNIMAKLGTEQSIDRIDDKTGKPVRDALS